MQRIRIIAATLVIIVIASVALRAKAEKQLDGFYEDPRPIRCTCYIEHGVTASGKHTRANTIAGAPEWLGYTAALYEMTEEGGLGEFIGYYEFIDTGAGIDTDGDGKGDTILNGESVDVWQPDMDHANQWVEDHGDYVMMKIIRGKG